MASVTKHVIKIAQIIVIVVCALLYHRTIQQQKKHTEVTPSASASASEAVVMATMDTAIFDVGDVKEIFGVKIERNPSLSKLDHLAVFSWPKWGCGPSKIPWTFSATETMYLLEGKVKVYCDGHDEFFEIGAGDLVQFPKGMKITWDVIEAVSKHYNLEK